jgi:hypothetical protein
MSGTHPRKLEMRCRACGILCYRNAERRWTHEEDPPEPHDPAVRWFGGKKADAGVGRADEPEVDPEPE